MRLFSKKHFHWKEPKAFLELSDAFEKSKLRWWRRPVWTLVIATMMLMSWAGAHFNPHRQPPPFLVACGLAAATGIFCAYLAPWLLRFFPSEVRFYDAYLIRSRGDAHRQIKYAELESFGWGARGDFATLVLNRRDRKGDILIGVPNEVSRDAVSEFLIEHAVRFDGPLPDAGPRMS